MEVMISERQSADVVAMASFSLSDLSNQTAVPNFTAPPADCAVKDSEFFVNVVVMGLLSVFGLVVNILTVITLGKDRQKLPTTVILQGLAITDSVFLVYTLFYSSLRTVILYSGITDHTLYTSKCIFAFALPWGWTSQMASIWIIALVTTDRYLAICHPFYAEKYCTLPLTRRVIVGVCVASVLFNIPRFVYYYYMAFETPGSEDLCGIYIGHNDMTKDKLVSFRTIYQVGLTFVFYFIIPFPIIAGLNVKLMKEIASVKQRSPTPDARRDRSVKVTVNLIAVVTVFIICETPDLVASVLKLDHVQSRLDPTALDVFMTVKELLLVINSATNFLIYCLFYQRFRKLLRVVCCHTQYEHGPNSASFLKDPSVRHEYS